MTQVEIETKEKNKSKEKYYSEKGIHSCKFSSFFFNFGSSNVKNELVYTNVLENSFVYLFRAKFIGPDWAFFLQVNLIEKHPFEVDWLI